MAKFDEFAHPGKCEVCGKETQVVTAAASMGPMSLSYCKDCLNAGAEPYWVILAHVSSAGYWPEDIKPEKQECIRKMLAYLGKTEEEFAKDVAVQIEKFGRF